MDECLNNPAAVTALALEALSSSICASFIGMIGIPAEISLDRVEILLEDDPNIIVAGSIGLVGNWKGTGILECSPDLACQMSNLMLGVEDSALRDDGMDAVAEMSNIIFGTMKTRLEETLGCMGMSTPTVVCGSNLDTYQVGDRMMTIPVKVGDYTVLVKLSITRSDEQHRPPAAA